jgi:hypothetical protein
MRVSSVLVALGALLCVLAVTRPHHKPATAAAGRTLSAADRATLLEMLADPVYAEQLNRAAGEDQGASMAGVKAQFTDAKKAKLLAGSLHISEEDALSMVEEMRANVVAQAEASRESAADSAAQGKRGVGPATRAKQPVDRFGLEQDFLRKKAAARSAR